MLIIISINYVLGCHSLLGILVARTQRLLPPGFFGGGGGATRKIHEYSR